MFEFENDSLKKIGFQFFAEKDDDKGDEGGDNKGAGEEEKKEEDQKGGKADEKKEDEKKPDLEALKKQWLKDMGFDDEDDEEVVKGIAQQRRKEKEEKMSDEEKHNKKLLEEKQARIAAEKEAAESKAMVLAMKKGADPEQVEDVITLAMKRTGNKADGLESAIEEVKKSHPSMFVDKSEENDKNKMGKRGTGNPMKSKDSKKKEDEDSIGLRLAKMRVANKKSSFFSR